ncbi:hypothetical protein [Oceanotoga phage vB_OteS-UFV02]
MANTYALNEDFFIRFKDATATTPFTLDLEGVESGTEVPKGVRTIPQWRAVHRKNKFINYKKDLEEVPEVTMDFTVIVVDDYFKGTGVDARHAIEQWFANKKAWDATGSEWVDLVSTNNETTPATLVRTDSDNFTVEMQILWDNTNEDKATGYLFKWVELIDYKFVNDDDLKMTMTVRVLTRDSEVEYIQALS